MTLLVKMLKYVFLHAGFNNQILCIITLQLFQLLQKISTDVSTYCLRQISYVNNYIREPSLILISCLILLIPLLETLVNVSVSVTLKQTSKDKQTFAHLSPHLKEPTGLSKEYIRIYIEYKLAQTK